MAVIMIAILISRVVILPTMSAGYCQKSDADAAILCCSSSSVLILRLVRSSLLLESSRFPTIFLPDFSPDNTMIIGISKNGQK